MADRVSARNPAPPAIHVSAEPEAGDWRFSVRDNGTGVPPEQRERIFQLFKRAPTCGAVPGLGLGLAICKKIVERHGGRIWVESEPGSGSTFRFTLPNGQ